MKTKRRAFAFLLVLCTAATALLSAQAPDKPAAKQNLLVYVGTYTTKTNSKGIYAYRFDAVSGRLSAIGIAAETPDPSWVAVHPNGKFLYAVNEAGKSSTVSAFALEPKTGKLTLLNQLPALGEDPCYLSFDKTGKYLFVANYTSGNVVVFPIEADGKLGAATANVRDEGKVGPNKERQDGPHAHWIETSADNRVAYVADLGLDKVLIYPFDETSGRLANAGVLGEVALPASSGPRHLAFSHDRKFMYVLGELKSNVTAFAKKSGEPYKEIQTISAIPKGFSGRNDAAEIAIHPNGKFLCASNRGHDSIAVFNVQRRGGRLSLAANVPTGGKEPRHFVIDPTGKFLLAENQLSNNIVVFKIDPTTGGLTPTGQVVDVPSPVCIAFLPVE